MFKGDFTMAMGGAFINIMVAVIIGIGVSVPIASSVITSANLTGTDAVLAGFITTLIIVAIVVGITNLM